MNSSGSANADSVVDEAAARAFLQQLIPVPEHLRVSGGTNSSLKETRRDSATSTGSNTPSNDISKRSSLTDPSIPAPIPGPSRLRNSSVQDGNSRATSRSRYANGTMTSTAMSVYHTASSSLIDSGPPTPSGRMRDGNINTFWDPEVEQAIASNSEGVVGEGEVALDSGYRGTSPTTPTAETTGGANLAGLPPKTNGSSLEVPVGSPGSSGRRRLASSNSGESVQTVTPSRLNSGTDVSNTKAKGADTSTQKQFSATPKPPIGPALFFTSAKTGEGLSEVFEYISERVTKQWEWEASQLHMLESGGNPGTSGNGDSRIILRDIRNGSGDGSMKKWSCC
ncbi:hypothetical protein M408DRAFT_89929 [Serendipita vermifera MAFF 305830]|uniref:Uncharacterized protein n=1 Tax=Serendipita vermifera MAFF 305830 TaxID=933852 RepID=A0A0C2XYW8_SERVB|nr:hypothetical protein M408DRAFT_89929 [Serendipita vermifera MAFF 305830]